MSSAKKITLESSDGQSFKVDEAVAAEFHFKQPIKYDRIRLREVTGETLAKVIEYCEKHGANNSTAADEERKAWEAELVAVDQATLLKLLRAAHSLKIKGLVILLCEAVSAMIRGKTCDQIRETFNFTGPKGPPISLEEAESLSRKNKEWVKEFMSKNY